MFQPRRQFSRKRPTEIQIHFSERVEPRVSSITVLAPDGSRADLSNSAADPADPRVYRVGLKDGGAGTYTVSWQVISADDGHFAKGAYVFSVGNARPSAATDTGGFQTVHSSSVPEALTLAVELDRRRVDSRRSACPRFHLAADAQAFS